MKALKMICSTLALVLVGGMFVMAAAGWLSLHNTDDETNIKIDRKEIKEDVDEAIDQGRKLLKEGQDEIDEQREDETETKDATGTPKTDKDDEREKESLK